MNKRNNMDVCMTANVMLPDFCTEIAEIIRSNLSPKKLQERILSYHEKDIAMALVSLTEEERRKLFKILQLETIVNILEYSENSVDQFNLLSIRQKVEALSLLEVSTAADILFQLPKEERTSFIDLMSPERRSEIHLLRSFDEDEIGSEMSTNFIVIPDNLTIKEAMSELIRQAADNDNISTIYVVDETKTFCGAIDLKEECRLPILPHFLTHMFMPKQELKIVFLCSLIILKNRFLSLTMTTS